MGWEVIVALLIGIGIHVFVIVAIVIGIGILAGRTIGIRIAFLIGLLITFIIACIPFLVSRAIAFRIGSFLGRLIGVTVIGIWILVGIRYVWKRARRWLQKKRKQKEENNMIQRILHAIMKRDEEVE